MEKRGRVGKMSENATKKSSSCDPISHMMSAKVCTSVNPSLAFQTEEGGIIGIKIPSNFFKIAS
jgi:hypothetical protein